MPRAAPYDITDFDGVIFERLIHTAKNIITHIMSAARQLMHEERHYAARATPLHAKIRRLTITWRFIAAYADIRLRYFTSALRTQRAPRPH